MGTPSRFDRRSRIVDAPHNRASAAYEQANESVVKLGESGILDPVSAAQMQYQTAQFEMMTAIHESLEQIERHMKKLTADI